jgi:acetyltransferase-like isoleucine patch superfamily enzyme
VSGADVAPADCAAMKLRKLITLPWNFLLRIVTRVRFSGRRLRVDPSSWVAWGARLRTSDGGRIDVGRHCEIHPLAMLLAYGGSISLGDHCSVNPFAVLYGHGGLRIGNGVRIAAHVVIIPANHVPATEELPLHASGVVSRGIQIDDDVWIGAGARILDGVHIGKRAIVGAGSVVTRAVPAGATVAGVPARVICQQ